MKILISLFWATLAAFAFSSCSSMEEAGSAVVPDRDKEGFTGPGVRMGPDIPKSDVNEVDIHRRGPRGDKETGVDFFQYKHKF